MIFLYSFMTRSTSWIILSVTARDYQAGLTRLLTSSMRSPLLLAMKWNSSVLVRWRTVCPCLFLLQLLPPENIIDVGIGVVLLVSIFLGPILDDFFYSDAARRPRMSTRVKKSLLITSNVSKTSSNTLNLTPKCHQRTR